MTEITTLTDPGSVLTTDQVMILRGGTLYKVPLSELFAALQPAITLAQGQVAARSSSPSGPPQAVPLGVGLTVGGGTLHATATDHAGLSVLGAYDDQATVVVNSAGAPALISMIMLRNGLIGWQGSLVTAGLTAVTGGQSSALLLPNHVNELAAVPTGGGVRFNPAIGRQTVLNRNGMGTVLSVFPPSGQQIEGGSVNAAVTISDGGDRLLVYNNAGVWRIVTGGG